MGIGTIEAKIVLNLSMLKEGIKEATLAFRNFSSGVAVTSSADAKAMTKMWSAGFLILSAAALKASQKFNAAFGDMIQTFATFEQSLANTQSVARASADELDAMEQAARRVGATTRSTASEAANALYYLASAGFSATESIAALDGVNALAIATGSDLAKTSETIATTIRQYGLETSAATDIANTFTAAITSSLATMDKLQKSFEYTGPIAAGLGLSVEETTGALELLYNKGFSGEKAGRGLRTILVNLADSTSVVNRKLAKLGVTFEEINPTTNSLADIFDTLREHEVNATNAAAIFGKVSGVQLASLVAQASDAKGGLNELTAAVTGTNRAFEAMDIQMDTLQGSIDQFKNASEALKIATGKGLEPVLRALVDTATDFVRALAKLNPKLLGAGAAIGVLVTGSLALSAALVSLLNILVPALAASGALLGIFLTTAGAISGVVAGVVGLTVAIKALNKANLKRLHKEFDDIIDKTDATEEEVVKKLHNMKEAVDNVRMSSPDAFNDIDQLRKYVDNLSKTYELSRKETIKLIAANNHFGDTAKNNVNILAAEIDAEEARKQAIIDSANSMINTELVFQDHLKKMQQINKDIEKSDQDRIRNTAEAYRSLGDAFFKAEQYEKLLGKEYDRNAELHKAYEASIKSLIDQGLTAESQEVKDLIDLYKQLQKDYGVVGEAGLTWTEKRQQAEDDLKATLEAINEQEKFSIANGIEYNAEKERSAAVVNTINKMIAEGFTYEGRGVQKIINDYGEYIIVLTDIDQLYQEYSDKVEKIGKDELELLEIDRKKAIEKAVLNNASQEAIDLINEYYNLVKKGIEEKAIKKQQDEIKNYTDKLKELKNTELENIELEREKALVGVEAGSELEKAINAYYDALRDQEKYKEFTDNFKQAIDIATQYLDAFTDIYTQYIDNLIEQENRLLDEKLTAIETERDAELEAAGLVEQTKKEKLEQELADAIASGDAQNIQEAQDALDRYNINKKYDDLAAKAKEDNEKKVAQLNYKADLANWTNDLLSSIASGALAILKALDLGPIFGIPAAAVMGPLVAAQTTAVAMAKPKKPAFENGGIVPGSSFKGDLITAQVNSGELIMNKVQQDRLAAQLDTSNEPIFITVNTLLDGKIVATNSAEYYRNGQVKL